MLRTPTLILTVFLMAPASAAGAGTPIRDYPDTFGACQAKLDAIGVVLEGDARLGTPRFRRALDQAQDSFPTLRNATRGLWRLMIGNKPVEAEWLDRWDALYQDAYAAAMRVALRRTMADDWSNAVVVDDLKPCLAFADEIQQFAHGLRALGRDPEAE